MDDNSFGKFQVPQFFDKEPDKYIPMEGHYLRLRLTPPPRIIREALLKALPAERPFCPTSSLAALWDGDLPIFVVRWFMNLQGAATTRFPEKKRFFQALWLIEAVRIKHYLGEIEETAGADVTFHDNDDDDQATLPRGPRKLPLFDFLPPPPGPPTTKSRGASTEPASTTSTPAAAAVKEEHEEPPRILEDTPELDVFKDEANDYIRGFGPVPCAAVHPSRLRNLSALFSKLKQMYSAMDPSWAITTEEKQRLEADRQDISALLTMARPRLASLQEAASKAKVPEAAAEPRPTLLAKRRIPVREFIQETHGYIQTFAGPVLPVHPSRLENLRLVLDRINETMELLLDPEEGTTSDEVKELTANREDLEGLKELAEKILKDLDN